MPFAEGLPSDSPIASSYSYNTYTQLGWTDINVLESGDLTEVVISYTWDTDSWPDEGSFRIKSPEGTEVTIAHNETDGTYNHTLTDFAGENLNGNWELWIYDNCGDGGHRATDISITFTYTTEPSNPTPANNATDQALSGSLSWDYGEGTNTYDLWLGPSGNMSKVVDGAAAGASGSYAYSGLDYAAEYEWQVIEYHTDETINGAIWSFETEGYTVNTYTYTGAEESWTVPEGVTEIKIKSWGAGGASSYINGVDGGGGSGGYTEGRFSVTPGQQLIIAVGGGGEHGSHDWNGGNGGWPGGGFGTIAENGKASGGGGGYSGVFLGSHSQSNALIIAGAGGGAGAYSFGGAGGGETGNAGGNVWNSGNAGHGGTQTAGGTGTEYGDDGSALQGGNGDQRGTQTQGSGTDYSGSGGGGGYYGGEGGQDYNGGGGGGSSYINPTYVIGSGTLTTGNNGEEESGGSAPNSSDPDYIAENGDVGNGAGANELDDAGNGLIVIKYAEPMSFVSSTTETATTDEVFTNSELNPVIRLKVVTSGLIDPVSASSITFSTNGTTNTSDLSNAEVFYTTNTTFSNATQFGTGHSNPSGTLTFNGDQQLNAGNNYFWLCYDVPSDAGIGNIIDGTCSSVTVDGSAHTPDTEAPAGSRTIADNPFPGGAGNSGSPFQIATTTQLIYLSQHTEYWDQYFIQTTDLSFNEDETQVDWDGDGSPDGIAPDGFSPIGNSTTKFTGGYNGDGHSIDNLYIDRSATDYIGLFGYLSGADIDGVNLNDVDFTGNKQSGALTGRVEYSTIDDCFVSGSVTGADNCGGLAGDVWQRSNINDCGANVTVFGTISVGGFAGRLYHYEDIDNNKPSITNSYATGNATATSRNVGGFVGWHVGLISQSYARGSAFCTDALKGRVGGFAGAVAYYGGSTGKIDNCFCSGYVSRSGTNYNSTYGIGGFVGIYYGGGSITNCYSTGLVPHSGFYGGFCGYYNSNGTSEGNYYNKETSYCDDTNGDTHPITTREMQTQGTFAGWDFMGESTNGSDNIWGINPFDQDGLPFLAWQGFDQFAVTPSGSGTEASPYQISTVPHLYWLSQYSQEWDKYYEQSTDIDASAAASWYDNAGFFPIGNENTGFAGHYEGNNHTVSNLTIDRSDENYIGLFGATDGATIENLSLTNANISGNAYVGALAGKTASTVVQYCYSSGTLLDGSTIGGLIGWNASSSEVKHCYNEATIDAHTKAGGLIGTNEAVVEYCYNSANIIGSSEFIGGLIGTSTYPPEYCYNTGQVSGLQYVGGLIGYGSAENCYNIGQVTADDYVGGLIGSGSASYCYNAGEVICTGWCEHCGGLTGFSSSSTTACYYDKNASGQSTDGGQSNGLSTMEMQMEYQYQAEYSYQSDWDFMTQSSSGIWGISPIVNDGYPFLSWQGYDLYGTEPDGSGTTEDPYVVDGLTDLYWISQKTDRWDDHYIQSCDIDASGTTFWCGGSGFLPFGAGDANDEFSGTYDGQEHDISSLWINREHEYEVGFIGKSYAFDNTVQNLGLPDAFIKGYKYVGGFVGYSNGNDEIAHCYISGTVTAGNDYVGGIVGYNHGSALTNCYSHASVSGNDYVGGLIGDLSHKNINDCYSKGFVSGNNYTGGLIGNGTNYVNNSFWDTQTSGQESSAAGTGKTTAEMTTLSTYTDAGWDFVGETSNGSDDYWDMDESKVVEDGYPFLGYQETPMDWTGAVSSDWNNPDNWSKSLGVPNEHKDITIEATKSHDPEIPNDGASINNLTVSSGASLTVGDGGSLITYGTITNEGTINIEKIIADDGHWHFIAAPTNNATAGLFSAMYLQQWNEAAKEWLDITDPEEDLSPVQGYSLWSPDGGKGSFTFSGTPNTGNQDISLDYHDNSAQNDGANLVGNPYPSYIDWAQVSGYGSKYTWNGADYDERTEAGTGNGSRYVAPMEGFFVVTGSSGNTFMLTNDMRTHNSAKKDASALSNGIVLSAKSQNYSDALYIVFDAAANENFELPRDAWKFISGTAGICQIWSKCPDGNLAVDVRPQTESIPLGFTNNEAGTYSIGIQEIADISTATLEDTKLNIFHDLTQGAYTFDWSLTDDETRFKLHLNTTAVEEINGNAVQAYVAGGNIIIQSESQAERVILTDIAGRTLGIWGNVENIPAPQTDGVYLVTVETGNQRITKKIIIE